MWNQIRGLILLFSCIFMGALTSGGLLSLWLETLSEVFPFMPFWDQVGVGGMFFNFSLGLSLLTGVILDKILPKKAINPEYARRLRRQLASCSVDELIDTAVRYAIAAETSNVRAEHARTR